MQDDKPELLPARYGDGDGDAAAMQERLVTCGKCPRRRSDLSCQPTSVEIVVGIDAPP